MMAYNIKMATAALYVPEIFEILLILQNSADVG